MNLKLSSGCFKCRIFRNPTNKLTQLLKKFKIKRTLRIRPLCLRTSQSKSDNSSSSPVRRKRLINRLKSVLFCSNSRRPKSVDRDRLMNLKSFSDFGPQQNAPNSSPITPAYVRNSAAAAEGGCRSFERCLVELILEEGKVNDLMDVEELLYCWMNLKCPIFKEVVCRFYGDLCKDLFSINN